MATDTAPIQIPIFPSSDFDRTAAFYGLLGFVETNRYGSHYLIVEHPRGIELHFYGAGKVKSKSNDHAAYVRFSSTAPVDELHEQWSTAETQPGFAVIAGKAGRVTEPIDTDYGLREFALLDSDGNLVRVGGVEAGK